MTAALLGALLPPTGIKCNLLGTRQSCDHGVGVWQEPGIKGEGGLAQASLPTYMLREDPWGLPFTVSRQPLPFICPHKAGLRSLSPWAMSWFSLRPSGPLEPCVLVSSPPAPSPGFSVVPTSPGHDCCHGNMRAISTAAVVTED